MLAVDTNILVYSHRREVAEHALASRVVRELAEGPPSRALPWPCLYDFFSIVTNVRIWRQAASTPAEAWDQIAAWLGSPSVQLLGETADFAAVLERFVCRPRVRGAVVHEARIAALCIAHGVEALLTRDRDFAQFEELSVRNPLK